MKAVKIIEPGVAGVVETDIPTLPSPSYVLIKVAAVALNPSDWKHVYYKMTTNRATMGCDYSGTIVEVGSDVKKVLKKGDRVWGVVHGSNTLRTEEGAFAEYTVALGDLVMKIPDGMGFEEAASPGAGVITVGFGLYMEMGLPSPDQPIEGKEKSILIYGGSTASGALGIQFAKLSGVQVIITCSPRNFDYVKSLGADAVFDYNSPTCASDIRKLTDNKLYYVWDTVGGKLPLEICAGALSSSPPEGQELNCGIITGTDSGPRDDVRYTHILGYLGSGLPVEMGESMKFPASPAHHQFALKWTQVCEKLLMEGKWKPHRPEVRSGGLEGVIEGMKEMRDKGVSGVKLVYPIAES
ncbi:GroES-like protein [Amniculicola lignicola CBS 123094]|uniref:GroES-like protein n=1 Tax=Amniculicola lignicola CBS 123094 TaxID=1392246 RepID=A0A6A5WMP1_9PLEO|nr:GroES-like protein [Amniculicola lignicola CBS 123094]